MKKRLMICIITAAVIVCCFACCKAGNGKKADKLPDGDGYSGLKNVITEEIYQVPIIMYHRVYTLKAGSYCITPQEFEEDLVYIRDNGYTAVTINELVKFKEGAFDMPDKPVALTFDDCNYNNYSHAFPLLKKYNTKATFFIIGEFSERFSDGRERYPATSHLSFDDIIEMNKSGLCDIQNHTYDFHDWTRGRFGVGRKENESDEDYKNALVSDIAVTQRLLKDRAGITPSAFAYPFGLYNGDAERIIAEMGFKAVVTTDPGVNIINRNGEDDILRLKRYNRPHGESLESIMTTKIRITD